MNGEEHGVTEHDPQLAALLRDALRASTPQGLGAAQRAVLLEASRVDPPRGRLAIRAAALLAIACALPLAAYLGSAGETPREQPVVQVPEPRDPRQEAAERARAEAELRERARAEEELRERARQAERAGWDEQRAAMSSAQEEIAVDRKGGKAARRAAAKASASKPEQRRAARLRAAKAGRTGTGRGVDASTACDPNDALCGL